MCSPIIGVTESVSERQEGLYRLLSVTNRIPHELERSERPRHEVDRIQKRYPCHGQQAANARPDSEHDRDSHYDCQARNEEPPGNELRYCEQGEKRHQSHRHQVQQRDRQPDSRLRSHALYGQQIDRAESTPALLAEEGRQIAGCAEMIYECLIAANDLRVFVESVSQVEVLTCLQFFVESAYLLEQLIALKGVVAKQSQAEVEKAAAEILGESIESIACVIPDYGRCNRRIQPATQIGAYWDVRTKAHLRGINKKSPKLFDVFIYFGPGWRIIQTGKIDSPILFDLNILTSCD